MKTTILFGATVAALLAAATSRAQTHKVTSPDSVVRAVGVYEWTGDLAKPTGSRLVPVTVFIDGHIEDGGVYLPRPVPFALVSGNVYELEDAGLAKGLIELESAVRISLPDGAPGPAFDEGWTGYGTYKPLAPPRRSTSAALKASKNLPVITTSKNDNDRPHFSNTGSDSGKSGTNSQSDTSKTDTAAASKPSTGSTSDDPDRPTMKRRDTSDTSPDSAGTQTSGTSDQTASNNSSDDPAERPTLKRRSPEDEKAAAKERKKNDVATVTAAGSLNDDPDRPTLHHGTPEHGAGADMPKLLGVPKDMHQMVAVSDAKSREPHPFARPWESPDERATILAKMQAFARTKLSDYGIVPGLTPPSAITSTSSSAAASTAPTTESNGPPKLKRGIPTPEKTAPAPSTPAAKTSSTTAKTPASTSAKGRRTATKGPAPITLGDEDLKGYLLSYGGAPTFVYMAHTVEDNVMRYVTVVAQADAMGELKLAMANVTDAAHLDRTPWMRLIDAVDVEASNRASLLFELRGQSSRQFVLYRVIATKPEQIFATANP